MAIRCAYFALLSGSSIWRFQVLASHHAHMGARSQDLRAAEEDWTSSTSALRLGYHVANVCGTRSGSA